MENIKPTPPSNDLKDKNKIFADQLRKFAKLFENGFDKDEAKKIRLELKDFDKNEAIELWLDLLREHCPVEEISENNYEIHDLVNFLGEGDANDYIHTVKILESDDTASVFMKFYFIMYCVANKLKSKEYVMANKPSKN